MHRSIPMVVGASVLLLLGGRYIVQSHVDAQDSALPAADTYANYAKRSLHVGDQVVYVGTTVLFLTKEQSKQLSTRLRGEMATVTGIGKDYFVVRAEAGKNTGLEMGPSMIEKAVRFDAIKEFQKYVNDNETPKSP